MKKIASLSYAITAYAIGLSSLVYMIGFLANLYVPKGIDAGSAENVGVTLIDNILLVIGYFALHSIMARPRFKHWWTRIIPAPIERSTYVLVSGITFFFMVLLWQPLDAIVWSIDNAYGRGLVFSIYLSAWVMMLFATFNIDHFSFFGLRQVWTAITEKSAKSSEFSAKYLYRFTRHPISLCWFIVLWLTPSMSLGHLVFASIGSVYIIIVTPIEERDLANEIGAPYDQYKKDVRRFVPLRK